jgi:hypothetical protein
MKKYTTNQLKETSVIDASATPPTTGTREPNTSKEGACKNRIIENNVFNSPYGYHLSGHIT